jgi:hypothetical protein
MLDGMLAQGRIRRSGEALALTGEGEAFVQSFGLDLVDLKRGRRPLCKGCLDWSVRRTHLAGAVGAGLLQRIFDLGWARRLEGGRAVAFTPQGLKAFEQTFYQSLGGPA